MKALSAFDTKDATQKRHFQLEKRDMFIKEVMIQSCEGIVDKNNAVSTPNQAVPMQALTTSAGAAYPPLTHILQIWQ